jgi:cysteine desulfuration protein SufE
MPSFDQIYADYELIDDRFDRIEFVVDLGKALEPMPEALKTAATLVPGCQAKVWVYPVPGSTRDNLHFLADSNSGMTKGIVALILSVVEGRTSDEVLAMDIEKKLEPFGLEKHLTSVRTSGLKSMIKKIRETAQRLAA